MNWILNNWQTVVNWFLAGGFSVTTVMTIVKTLSQNKLNKKFDELNSSVGGTVSVINDMKQVAKDLIKAKEAFNTEARAITSLLEDFMNNPIIQTDVISELVGVIKNLDALTSAIDYKDDILEAYSKDIKSVRIQLANIQNRGV